MQESIVFLVRVQCRRKESSRSLSHLLMSFLYSIGLTSAHPVVVSREMTGCGGGAEPPAEIGGRSSSQS